MLGGSSHEPMSIEQLFARVKPCDAARIRLDDLAAVKKLCGAAGYTWTRHAFGAPERDVVMVRDEHKESATVAVVGGVLPADMCLACNATPTTLPEFCDGREWWQWVCVARGMTCSRATRVRGLVRSVCAHVHRVH